MAPPRDRLLDCAAMVQQVATAHQDAAQEAARKLGIPVPAAALLYLLGRERPEMSMRDLAGALSCDPSNVTLQAIALEKDGLVERVPDTADRRRRIPRLTQRGCAAGDTLAGAVAGTSPLADLDEQQLAALTQTLRTALREP